jgi:hypothetical protein
MALFASLYNLPSLLFVVLGAFIPPVLLLGFNRQALRLVGAIVLPVGFLGTMIGMVQMLQQMDDATAIGPAVSVALLTSVYAIGFKLLLDLLPEDEHPVRVVSFAKSAVAGCVLLAVVLAAICMGSKLEVFWDVRAAGSLAVGALLIAGLAQSFGSAPLDGLVRQLPTLAVLILASSLLIVFTQLNAPREIGPTMAWGFLGALYASLAAVLVRLLALSHVERPARRSQWGAFAALNVGGCVLMAQVALAIVMNG